MRSREESTFTIVRQQRKTCQHWREVAEQTQMCHRTQSPQLTKACLRVIPAEVAAGMTHLRMIDPDGHANLVDYFDATYVTGRCCLLHPLVGSTAAAPQISAACLPSAHLECAPGNHKRNSKNKQHVRGMEQSIQ